MEHTYIPRAIFLQSMWAPMLVVTHAPKFEPSALCKQLLNKCESPTTISLLRRISRLTERSSRLVSCAPILEQGACCGRLHTCKEGELLHDLPSTILNQMN